MSQLNGEQPSEVLTRLQMTLHAALKEEATVEVVADVTRFKQFIKGFIYDDVLPY